MSIKEVIYRILRNGKISNWELEQRVQIIKPDVCACTVSRKLRELRHDLEEAGKTITADKKGKSSTWIYAIKKKGI